MVKRCIGIDVGSSYLCAVQVMRIGGAFCIEKVFETQARRDTDSASETLRALVDKHGFDRRAAIAISVPSDAVFFRNVETDSAGLEQVREAGYSIFDNDFPIEAAEMVTQPCSYRGLADQKYSILTAAVAKESLRRTGEIVASAKMRARLIETTVFSVHSTVSLNHPESRSGVAIIAHVGESSLTLAITEDNRTLAVRHFPIAGHPEGNGPAIEQDVGEVLSREVGITWGKLFETEIEQDTRVFVVAAGENAADLRETIEENLHCRTVLVNPYARLLLKHVGRPKADISIAEGLALRTLAPEHTSGINFLGADTVETGPAPNLKKELAVCVLLVAAIAAASIVGLFMKRSRLERRYATLRSQINASFRSALPEEKNIVDPVAQLEQRLASLRKDHALFGPILGTGVRPLSIWEAVTRSTPAGVDLSLDDMLITTDSVRLTGTCKGSESVYAWQRSLQGHPKFSVVEVEDAEIEPGGELMRFTVVASFAVRGQS